MPRVISARKPRIDNRGGSEEEVWERKPCAEAARREGLGWEADRLLTLCQEQEAATQNLPYLTEDL